MQEEDTEIMTFREISQFKNWNEISIEKSVPKIVWLFQTETFTIALFSDKKPSIYFTCVVLPLEVVEVRAVTATWAV